MFLFTFLAFSHSLCSGAAAQFSLSYQYTLIYLLFCIWVLKWAIKLRLLRSESWRSALSVLIGNSRRNAEREYVLLSNVESAHRQTKLNWIEWRIERQTATRLWNQSCWRCDVCSWPTDWVTDWLTEGARAARGAGDVWGGRRLSIVDLTGIMSASLTVSSSLWLSFNLNSIYAVDIFALIDGTRLSKQYAEYWRIWEL